MPTRKGAYGGDSDLTDFVLGITFEIWEERGVELIGQYYADDCVIYGLDGITRGAQAVIDATNQMLGAFPDRVLLAENVIRRGDARDGYTSHRLTSVMTNRGATDYGPPTNLEVRIMNVADCVVENGKITREWLVRDNHAFATQLGASVLEAAQRLAASRTEEYRRWMASEHDRPTAGMASTTIAARYDPRAEPKAFAERAMATTWLTGECRDAEWIAPYCVLYRSPIERHSGATEREAHYRSIRESLSDVRLSVDHVCSHVFDDNGVDIAVRWVVAGKHVGDYAGIAPSGKPIVILGVTHYRCIAGRITGEWTVFDSLAVMSQMLS